jgi:6-phosphogluconolactonase
MKSPEHPQVETHVFQPRNAAELFFKDLEHALSFNRKAVIGLAGGRSLDPLYAELAKHWKEDPLRIEFFLIDERVTDTPDERNSLHLEQVLIGPLAQRLGHSSTLYVPQESGSFPFPRCDILLLSAGEDGHIASLFPGNKLLESQKRAYLEVRDAPKPPPHRYTISPAVVRDSHSVMLFFLGPSKTRAFLEFSKSDNSVKNCPARIALDKKSAANVRRVFR